MSLCIGASELVVIRVACACLSSDGLDVMVQVEIHQRIMHFVQHSWLYFTAFFSFLTQANFFFFFDVLNKDNCSYSVSKYNLFSCFGF